MTQELTVKRQLELVREELLENTEAVIALSAHGCDLEEQERMLLNKIVCESNPEFANLKLEHDTNLKWGCDNSPTGCCVYDDEHDRCHDDCLYCGHPEERK